jgi:hypothetical protein
MQPLRFRRSRRAQSASGWSSTRPVLRHPYASYALFYLALFASEAILLGYVLWSGATSAWPVWKVASVILANLLFALMVGNHHISRASKQIAADIVLAGVSMLALIALTVFVAPDSSSLKILAYAWLCALLVNILHYYPRKRFKTRKRY